MGSPVLVIKGGALGKERYVLGVPAEEQPSLIEDGEVCIFAEDGGCIRLRSGGRIEIEGDLYINGEKYEPAGEVL